jgi:hypothetical protein
MSLMYTSRDIYKAMVMDMDNAVEDIVASLKVTHHGHF